MSPAEIESIVTRVLGGEIDAYEAIIRGYQSEVWKVVAAMLLNRQRTEDVVQEAFINAYQQLHRFQCGRDFGAWIKEIARNQVRQEIRRGGRQDRRLELYHAHLVQQYDGPSGPQERQEAVAEALARCTTELPASSAKLVELRYQSALGFEEIAAIIGRTVEATRQQLARIRLTLRECVEKRLVRS